MSQALASFKITKKNRNRKQVLVKLNLIYIRMCLFVEFANSLQAKRREKKMKNWFKVDDTIQEKQKRKKKKQN